MFIGISLQKHRRAAAEKLSIKFSFRYICNVLGTNFQCRFKVHIDAYFLLFIEKL